MSYKLVKEHPKTFELMHPDGSSFHIAKEHVGPEVHKRIKDLEPVKMAHGGEAEYPDENSSTQPTDEAAINAAATGSGGPSEYQNILGHYQNAGVGGISGGPESRADTDYQELNDLRSQKPESLSNLQAGHLKDLEQWASGSQAIQSQTPIQTPAVTAVQGPSPASTAPSQQGSSQQQPQQAPVLGSQNMPQGQAAAGMPGVGNYFDTLLQSNDALTKQMVANGQASAKDINDAQSKANLANKTYDDQLDQNQKEYDNLFNAVLNGKIDPNRFFHDMSTGNKILSAISVALSGIGSGLNGQPNMAMGVIQKNIDRDIEAQRLNLGKTQTLLSENLRKYGTIQDAKKATTAQLWAGVSAKMQARAAQTGSAQAMAQNNNFKAQLGLQLMQLNRDLALRQTANQVYGAQGQQGGVPVSQENPSIMEQAIPGYGKTRIQVGNRAYQATTEKDAEHLRDFQSEYEPVRQMVTRLGQLGPDAAVPGTEANNQANAIRAGLVPRLNKMHGLNRLSEEDVKLMGAQVQDPTKFSQLLNGGIRNTEFFKNLNEDAESQYSTRLKGYKNTASYGFKEKQ